MEAMKLSEIPLPQLSDGTMAVKNEPETIDEVLKKCEDLGWMWIMGLFPTHHPKNLIFDWLGFGHTNPSNRKDRLYSSPNSEAWSRLYTIIIKFLQKKTHGFSRGMNFVTDLFFVSTCLSDYYYLLI